MGFIAGAITSAADPQMPPPDGLANDPRVMPMQRIVESIMRGNGEVQAQGQAKDLGGKQMDATKKLSVTMTANPDDPGNPLIHVKNATADILNNTQESDLRKAYEAPRANVDSAIAKMSASTAPAAQPPTQADPAGDPSQTYDLIDKTLGYHVPRPSDPDIAEKLTSPEGIRALTHEMGGTKHHADQALAAMRRGQLTADDMRGRISAYRAQKLNAIYEKAVKGPLDEAQQIQQRKQAESDRKSTEERLLRSQTDAEQKTVYSRHNAINKAIDYSLIDPGPNNEGWHKAFDDQNDTGVPATPQEYAAIDRTGAQRVNASFLDFTDTKKDTFALGNYATWDDAKKAFGHPLTPQQDAMGAGRWKAAHTYAVRKANDDSSMLEARAAKLEHLQYLNEHQGDVKPVPLDDGFVKNVSAADLLGVLPTVKNPDLVLQRKEALLQNEIRDRSDKLRKAQQDAKALNAEPADRRQFRWPVDMANAQVDAKTHADRIAAAQSELQQIQAARAARKGDAAPVKDAPARILTKAEALKKLSGQ